VMQLLCDTLLESLLLWWQSSEFEFVPICIGVVCLLCCFTTPLL
jgi:hypothetical protein